MSIETITPPTNIDHWDGQDLDGHWVSEPIGKIAMRGSSLPQPSLPSFPVPYDSGEEAMKVWLKSFSKSTQQEEENSSTKIVSPPVLPTTIKDSGSRETFSTGAVRDNGGEKGMYAKSPHYAIHRLAVHMQRGASKYGPDNWRKGMPLSRTLDSLLRHAHQYADGDRSEDHLAAVLFNAAVLLETERAIELGKLPKDLADLELYAAAP